MYRVLYHPQFQASTGSGGLYHSVGEGENSMPFLYIDD